MRTVLPLIAWIALLMFAGLGALIVYNCYLEGFTDDARPRSIAIGVCLVLICSLSIYLTPHRKYD